MPSVATAEPLAHAAGYECNARTMHGRRALAVGGSQPACVGPTTSNPDALSKSRGVTYL